MQANKGAKFYKGYDKLEQLREAVRLKIALNMSGDGQKQSNKTTVKPALGDHIWDKEKCPYKTGDLLKEVQYI